MLEGSIWLVTIALANTLKTMDSLQYIFVQMAHMHRKRDIAQSLPNNNAIIEQFLQTAV